MTATQVLHFCWVLWLNTLIRPQLHAADHKFRLYDIALVEVLVLHFCWLLQHLGLTRESLPRAGYDHLLRRRRVLGEASARPLPSCDKLFPTLTSQGLYCLQSVVDNDIVLHFDKPRVLRHWQQCNTDLCQTSGRLRLIIFNDIVFPWQKTQKCRKKSRKNALLGQGNSQEPNSLAKIVEKRHNLS